VQHGKTGVSNLPSFSWRATIVDWSANVNVKGGYRQHRNRERNQKTFASALHGDFGLTLKQQPPSVAHQIHAAISLLID